MRDSFDFGEGVCKDLSCPKALVEDRKELESALNDVTGTDHFNGTIMFRKSDLRENFAKDAKILQLS